MENLDTVILNHLQSFLSIEDRMKPLYKKWTSVYQKDPFYKNRMDYPMNKYVRNPEKGMKWAVRYNRIDWITHFARSNSYYLILGLREAAKQGNMDLIKFIVKKRAKKRVKKRTKKTSDTIGEAFSEEADQISNAMAKASGKGHWEIVKYFIELGADKHCWQMSIDRAAREGRLEMVQFLTHQQSQDSRLRDSCSHILQYLSIVDEYHDIYLYNAAIGGNMELIHWLIQQGKGEWSNWREGLMGSVCSGKLEVVKFFLSRCKLVVKKLGPKTFDQGDLDCALEWAAGKYGNTEIFHFLLSLGARMNKHTFCFALRGTHLDIAQIIIDNIGISNIVNDNPKLYYGHLQYKCMFDFLNDVYKRAVPILGYQVRYDPMWCHPRKFH